jgi:uncharacterized metal-binding protein
MILFNLSGCKFKNNFRINKEYNKENNERNKVSAKIEWYKVYGKRTQMVPQTGKAV